MKRIGLEKAFVIVLFVLVLIVFSFAERDTKKLDPLYSSNTSQKTSDLAASTNDHPPVVGKAASN